MSDFSASLVRERIIIVLKEDDPIYSGNTIVIRSNRMYLKLGDDKLTEKIVVRGQNMGDTLRMAGWIMDDHYRHGNLSNRKVKWDDLWSKSVSDYGKQYNKDNNWVAVYINGKPIYQTNKSPFIDIVEQCALMTLDNYDETMNVAETFLDKVGKTAQIEHSANIAATFTDTEELTRSGIMNRSGSNKHTFTFSTSGGKIRVGRILRCFMTAANFLDAINIVLFIKETQEKIDSGAITGHCDEAKQSFAAIKRRNELLRNINNFEKAYEVNYRPEKPNFFENI